MVALWTSVLAVGGTLLGAVVTHLFQRLAAAREAREAIEAFVGRAAPLTR
ncbi:hypothetical protein ACFVFD_12290 [Streptomyces fimicarius]